MSKRRARPMNQWSPASAADREFSGLRCTARVGRVEYGVFKERHAIGGRQWFVHDRPLDANGEPTYCWGQGSPYMTKAEALKHLDAAPPDAAE